MERKQYLRLKKDLDEYSNCENIRNEALLQKSIQIVLESLKKELDKPINKKEKDIIVIMRLIDDKDTDKLNQIYPKLMYNNLQEAINSNLNFEVLKNYTTLQLKVIYYLLTKDKENNAIKTSKKDVVQNSIKEVLFNNLRNQKLNI